MSQKAMLIVAGLATMVAGSSALAADPRHPIVQSFGAITPMPTAKERPDPTLRYWVLFSVTKAPASPDQVNPNLEKVARFVNLLGSRGGNWEILTASAFLTIIVPLLVFFCLQRYLVRGLLAGSVKGG